MLENINSYSVEELKSGYRFEESKRRYVCLLCGEQFYPGEVYPINGHFYEAKSAVKIHRQTAHPDLLHTLLHSDSRYLTVTDHQKQLLEWMGEGLSDGEIARRSGVTASTVRHQRFMFREKAKQAKLYLAVCELAEERGQAFDTIVEPHAGAKMLDDRYIITEEERDKILSLAFESLSPLRLKRFPPKEKKKLVILTKISESFSPEKRYTEPEVNGILSAIYDDYVTLRRYLIEYGFLERTTDCSAYWKKGSELSNE